MHTLASVAADAATGGINIFATPFELLLGAIGGGLLGYEVGGIVDNYYDITHPEVPSTYFSKTKNKDTNWATEQAKSEAQRTGRNRCDILAEMLKQAKCAGDTKKAQDIKSAQKWLGCRHHSKD